MRCPTCDQNDEVILEKSFGYTDYGDGIYYCERCKIRFQVEIFCDDESEVSE